MSRGGNGSRALDEFDERMSGHGEVGGEIASLRSALDGIDAAAEKLARRIAADAKRTTQESTRAEELAKKVLGQIERMGDAVVAAVKDLKPAPVKDPWPECIEKLCARIEAGNRTMTEAVVKAIAEAREPSEDERLARAASAAMQARFVEVMADLAAAVRAPRSVSRGGEVTHTITPKVEG